MYNELYHHGRLHQRWGVKNGPPYPLSRSTVSSVYGSRKAKKAAKKQEKIERKEAEKRAEEEKEALRKAADKERVLREGTATEILQYANELSTNEINEAVNRINAMNKLNNLSRAELEKGWDTVDKIMKKVGNVKDWTKTGTELWKNIQEAFELYEGYKKG